MSATPLDLTLAPEVRDSFERFLSSCGVEQPTLCLARSVVVDDRGIYREELGSWTYGAYGPERVFIVEPALREHGYELLPGA
jgi:hypothetical protein